MILHDGIDYDPKTLELIGACVITLGEILITPIIVFCTVMLIGTLLKLLAKSIIWVCADSDLQAELRKRSSS